MTSSATPALKEQSLWRTAWTSAPFLLSCWLSTLIFCALCGGVVYLVHPRLIEINLWLDRAIIAIFGGACLIVAGGLALITLTVITGIDLLYPHGKRSITVRVLFPIAMWLSRIIGINRDSLRTSFVKVNNAMTIAQRKRIKGDRILVLLPHCLQIDVCNRKITGDIENCVQCGRCPVGSLVSIGREYGLTIEVVNGGTLARRRVATFNPSGIIAVACERDLTYGILDVYPIPVYGVLNDRPNGPCFNTEVDMRFVEEAVRFFKQETS